MRRARATHIFVTRKDRIESDRLRRRELEEGEATSEETLKGSVIRVVDSTEVPSQEDVELKTFQSFYSSETETVVEEDQPSFRRLSEAPGRIILTSDEAIAGPSNIHIDTSQPESSGIPAERRRELPKKRGLLEDPRETLIAIKRKSNFLNITNRYVDQRSGDKLHKKIIRKPKHRKRSIFCYREQEQGVPMDSEDREDDGETIKEVSETDEDTRTETEEPSDVEYLARKEKKKETGTHKSPTASNVEARHSLDIFKKLKGLTDNDLEEILGSDLQREDVIYSASPKEEFRQRKRKMTHSKADIATELRDIFLQDTPEESLRLVDRSEEKGIEIQGSAAVISGDSGDLSYCYENISSNRHDEFKSDTLKVSGAQGYSKAFTSNQKYTQHDLSRASSATQKIEKCSENMDLFRDASCYNPENIFSEDISNDESMEITCPSFKQLKLPLSPQFTSKVFRPGVVIHSSPATSCFKKPCRDNYSDEKEGHTVTLSDVSSVEISSGWYEESSEVDTHHLLPPAKGKIFTSKGCYCSLSQCEGPKITDKSKTECSNPDSTTTDATTTKQEITSENIESVVTKIIASREKAEQDSVLCLPECNDRQQSLTKQKFNTQKDSASKPIKIGEKKSITGAGKEAKKVPFKHTIILKKQSGTSKSVRPPSKSSSKKRISFSTPTAVKKTYDQIKNRPKVAVPYKKNIGKTTSSSVTASKLIKNRSKSKEQQKRWEPKPLQEKNIKPGISNVSFKPKTSNVSRKPLTSNVSRKPGASNVSRKPGTPSTSFKKKTGETTSNSTTESRRKKRVPKFKHQKKTLSKPTIRPCKPKPCLKRPKMLPKLPPCVPEASSIKCNEKQAIPLKFLNMIDEEKCSVSTRISCKQIIDENSKIEKLVTSASRIIKDATTVENKAERIPQISGALSTPQTTNAKPVLGDVDCVNKDTETSFLELEVMFGSKDRTLNQDFVSDEVLIRDIDMERCVSPITKCKIEVQTETKEEIGITTSNETRSKCIQIKEKDVEKELPKQRDVQIVASVRSFVNVCERPAVYEKPRRVRWRFERLRTVNEFIYLKAPILHQPATNVFYQAPPSIDKCIQYDAPEMDIEDVFRPEVRKPKYPTKNKRKVTFRKRKKENQWEEVWNFIANLNKCEDCDTDEDEIKYIDNIGEGAIVDNQGKRLFVKKESTLNKFKKIGDSVINIGGNVFEKGWELGKENIKSLLDLSLSGIDKVNKMQSLCKPVKKRSLTKKISNESVKVSKAVKRKKKKFVRGKKKSGGSDTRVKNRLLKNIFGSNDIQVRSSTLKPIKQDSEAIGTTRKIYRDDKNKPEKTIITVHRNESQKREFQNILKTYPLHSEVRIMPFTEDKPIDTSKDPHVLRGLRELNFPKETAVNIKICDSNEGVTECVLLKDKAKKPTEIELEEITPLKDKPSPSDNSSSMSKGSKVFAGYNKELARKFRSKNFKDRSRLICARVFMGLKNGRSELLSWFRPDGVDPETPSQDEINEQTIDASPMKGLLEEEAPLTGLSEDQQRVDFVLALNILDPPEAEGVKLDMLTAIAKTGVHMETELGTLKETQKFQFVKLTVPDPVLKKYGGVLNVVKHFGESHLKFINNRWTGLDQLNRARYEREWIRTIRKQYTIPMKMSNLERSYVVYMLLRQLRFGVAENFVGLHRLLRNNIVIKAYAMHDGPYYKPTQSDYRKYNARQILFLNWGQNYLPSMARQPLHVINEYFGSKLGFYFVFYEFYNRAMLFAALWGILMMFAYYTKSGEYLDFTLHHLCKRPHPYFLVQRKPNISFELNYHLDYKTYQVAAECEPSDPPGNNLVPNDNRTRCPYQYVPNVCGDLKLMQWFDNPYIVVYSFGMSVWALLFQRLWKRTESYYAWMWEESLCPPLATPRLEYRKSKRSPSTRKIVHKCKSFWTHFGRATMNGFLIPAIIVFITVLATVLVFMYAYINISKPLVVSKINDHFMTVHKTLDYVFLVLWTILIMIVLTLLERLSYSVAVQLVDFENHKYFEDYESSLLQKVFTYSFVIISAPIVYFAWIKGSFYYSPIESYNNFRLEMPWSKHKISQTNFTQRLISQNCNPFSCFRQAVVVFITTVLFRFGIISVFFNNIRHSSYSPPWGEFMTPTSVEREFLLPDPQTDVNVVFDINRLMVQFAVITLFAPLCPLAPIIAIFVNLLHIRSKAKELVMNTKRPVLYKAQGLGSWNFIMKLICYGVPLFHALTITHTEIFRRYLTYKTEVSLPNEWGRSNPMHREFKFAHMLFLGRFNVNRAHDKFHDHFQFKSKELKTMTNCCLDSMLYQVTNLTKQNSMWPNQPMLMKDKWIEAAPLPVHYYSRYLKVAFILGFLHLMAAIGAVLWFHLPSPHPRVARLRYRERALLRMRTDRLRFTDGGDELHVQAK